MLQLKAGEVIKVCLVTEHARAKQKIAELEAETAGLKSDVADLLEQLAVGVEKPSPADIVKQASILADNQLSRIIIDVSQLNIPFTKPPRILPIMEIPDTGSMDGLFDYGNNNLYIEPADETDHQIMVDWIAQTWLSSQGLQTVDAVTRIMVNEADDPSDYSKVAKWYAIHRLIEVGSDAQGRYFWFAGINNPERDPYPARDKNILWINIGTIF